MFPLLVFVVFLLLAIIKFLKEWIRDGIEIAISRTMRYVVVTGILSIIIIVAWFTGQQ